MKEYEKFQKETKKLMIGSHRVKVNIDFLLSVLNGIKDNRNEDVIIQVKTDCPLIIDDVISIAPIYDEDMET